MNQYTITSGTVVVTARSSIHDSKTVWKKMSGTLSVDPDNVGTGASAEIQVDMRAFDAGDRLKNWKLKGELKADQFPIAKFFLSGLSDVTKDGPATRAAAKGQLAWRQKEVAVAAIGSGKIDDNQITAKASFELDVRDVGMRSEEHTSELQSH